MSMQGKVAVQKVDLIDGEELQGLVNKVLGALAQSRGKLKKSLYLFGIYSDHIIARDAETGSFFKMSMGRDGKEISLSDATEVKQVFVPVSEMEKAKEKAVWTAAFINDLPDSSFLYIAPGGRKDGDGKTVPRSLRFFPVKDAQGNVDLPHLRNALSRIPQANIPQAAKDAARAKAQRMLEEATKGEEKDKDKKKTQKSEGTLVAVDGDVVRVPLTSEEVVAVLKALAEDGPVEYHEAEEKSLWAGVLT